MLNLLQSADVSAKHQVLCEAAKQLYGKQYDQIVARSATGVDSATPLAGGGEKILHEKAVAHFQKQMESYHHSISQMVYNMAKLGSET